MIKDMWELADLIKFKLIDFEKIDLPTRALENKAIRELIMDLVSKSRDKMFIAIKWFWYEELSLSTKYKFKIVIEIFSLAYSSIVNENTWR